MEDPRYNVYRYSKDKKWCYFHVAVKINITYQLFHFQPIMQVHNMPWYWTYDSHFLKGNDLLPVTVYLVDTSGNHTTPLMCRATAFGDGRIGVTTPSGVTGTYTLYIFGEMKPYK